MKKFILYLGILGVMTLPIAPLQAAEPIADITAQVNAYQDSGDINDIDMGAGLHAILTMAQTAEDQGNTADVAAILNAFSDKVDAAELDGMITASAAADLRGMAQ